MNELFNELKLLETNLDKLEEFNRLYALIEKIKKNKKLLSLIKKYNSVKDEKLREEIYSYQEIKDYKKCENDINFLILEIDNKLKDINIKRSCKNANN